MWCLCRFTWTLGDKKKKLDLEKYTEYLDKKNKQAGAEKYEIQLF